MDCCVLHFWRQQRYSPLFWHISMNVFNFHSSFCVFLLPAHCVELYLVTCDGGQPTEHIDRITCATSGAWVTYRAKTKCKAKYRFALEWAIGAVERVGGGGGWVGRFSRNLEILYDKCDDSLGVALLFDCIINKWLDRSVIGLKCGSVYDIWKWYFVFTILDIKSV